MRIHAVRQGIQLFSQPGRAQAPLHTLPVHLRAEGAGGRLGQRKAGRADLLKHRSEQRRIVVPAELRRGDAVDPDRAGCRRIQPAQELDECRFARAVQANKRHMLPGTERKTDIVQRVMRRPVIAE